jgi:hypothetical protein
VAKLSHIPRAYRALPCGRRLTAKAWKTEGAHHAPIGLMACAVAADAGVRDEATGRSLTIAGTASNASST